MNELNEQYIHLFNPQGDLTAEALWAYTHGGLDAHEMRAAQQHIAGCEMCTDAAEGVAKMHNKEQYFATINELKQRIDDKTDEDRKAIAWWRDRRLAVAALLLLLLGVSFVWLNYNNNGNDKTLASSDTAPKEPQLNKAADNKVEQSTPNASSGSAYQDSSSGNGAEVSTSRGAQPSAVNGQNGTAAGIANGYASANKTVMDSAVSNPNEAAGTKSYALTSNTPAPSEKKKDALEKQGKRASAPAATIAQGDNQDNFKSADKSEVMLDEAKARTEAAPDDIELQYPGGTDFVQHYVDSLRPNKGKSSRYPITVKLTLGTKGEISAVDFTHSPGINAKEKGQLEAVLKSMPFWKISGRRFSRPKRMSVTFNY